MMVPENYLKFQERIHSEASYCRLHKEKRPPVLSWDEILKYKLHIANVFVFKPGSQPSCSCKSGTWLPGLLK